MGGVGQLGEGEQVGSVYKQPEREVDDSCHIWREPSKWSGDVGVRNGHGGGRSRKVNAWYLYTLMVYL